MLVLVVILVNTLGMSTLVDSKEVFLVGDICRHLPWTLIDPILVFTVSSALLELDSSAILLVRL